MCMAKRVFGKVSLRVLPCLVPSNIHSVLFPVNEPHQSIAYPSFYSTPSSIHTSIPIYVMEISG